MANPRLSPAIKVARSGDLYLVVRGDSGILVNPGSGWAGEPSDVQAIVSHCNVTDPWSFIEEGSPGWPTAVAEAIDRLSDRGL